MSGARALLVSLALALPLTTGCSGKKELSPEELAARIDNQIAAARNMRAGNKVAEAEKIFKWVIEKDATRADGWAGLGQVRLEQKNLKEARELFAKAVEVEPNNRDAQEVYGRFLAAQGEYGPAAAALAVAYGDKLEDTKVGLAYGIALRESGDAAGSEKVLRAVAEEDEFIEHVYTELGELLRAQDRTDEALKAYLKAQKLHASDRRAQAGAALIYEKQGRYKYAADAWSLYVRMDCCSDYSKNVAQGKLKEMTAKEQAAIDAAAAKEAQEAR